MGLEMFLFKRKDEVRAGGVQRWPAQLRQAPEQKTWPKMAPIFLDLAILIFFFFAISNDL